MSVREWLHAQLRCPLRAAVLAAGLFLVLRTVLILSAPDSLVLFDQATWKHADLARDLSNGDLPSPSDLAGLAWSDFNFHQTAFIPYCLGFALFSLLFGTGYFSLYLYSSLFSALGVGAWTFLLQRYAVRGTAVAFALSAALLPIPGAMLQTRPWSGHVEAYGLATLALALALGAGGLWRGSRLRAAAAGLTAGASLSLSPLAAPLLAAALISAVLTKGAIRRLPRDHCLIAGAGIGLGLCPYFARFLFAGRSAGEIPVLEFGSSLPAQILSGESGPTFGEAFWPPLHLVFHPDSVTQAHAYGGLPNGDSVLGNAALIVASLLCLLWAWWTPKRRERMLALLLGTAPWMILAFVGAFGPDLALRYLNGLYLVGAAALSWVAAAGWARMRRSRSRAIRSLYAFAVLPWVLWLLLGVQGLTQVIDVDRWGAALRFDPGRLVASTGLRVMPPPSLWEDTLAFLEHRRPKSALRSAVGFDQPFRPQDIMSAAGWQTHPHLTRGSIRDLLLSLPAEHEGHSEQPSPARNAGWALAMAVQWNAEAFRAQMAEVSAGKSRWEALRGAAEGAGYSGEPQEPWQISFPEAEDRAAVQQGWREGFDARPGPPGGAPPL